MLALERHGHHSLWNTLCDTSTLNSAWLRVKRNGGRPGTDGVSVDSFERSLDRNLSLIQSHLAHYRPLPCLRRYVRSNNGNMRPLDVPSVRDRVVLRALLAVLDPIAEGYMAPGVFGFRRGRGPQAAIGHAEQLVHKGKTWAFRSDIREFFGTIDRLRLMRCLGGIIQDETILSLVDRFLSAGTVNNAGTICPGNGIAQGSCLSPLLSNIYLTSFDASMLAAGHDIIRYADDLLVLSTTRSEAHEAARLAHDLLADVGLALNSDKTSIIHADDGIEFLGFVIDRTGRQPNACAATRLQRRVVQISKATNTDSSNKVRKLKQLLQGWLNYYAPDAGRQAGTCDLIEELSEYLHARARLEAAEQDVRRIESRMFPRGRDNVLAASCLGRHLCHA